MPNVDRFNNDQRVPSFGPRMVCTCCRIENDQPDPP
jgi:hypothetical protein